MTLSPAERNAADDVLDVRDLTVEFHTGGHNVRAVDNMSFQIARGETLAIIGESGSGKSVTARTVIGLVEESPGVSVSGTVRLGTAELLSMSARERRALQGERIAMVFQDALSALNPVYPIGHQLAEILRVRRGIGRRESLRRAVELMERVRIPAARDRLRDFPHQFSGGMRQRIMIAMAIALDPDVLIADEPTTALDVTVQAQILELLTELSDDMGTALLFISHDMGVIASMADRIVVMYDGRAVEQGTVEQIFQAPGHPYSQGLLESMPRADRTVDRLPAIPGAPPPPGAAVTGCSFAERCPYTTDVCRAESPSLVDIGDGRTSACHYGKELTDGRLVPVR